MNAAVVEKVQAIFRKVFQEPSLEIYPEMTAEDVENWDSLTHVEMLAEVEKAFNIRFQLREIRKLKNVGEFIALIEQKIN